MVPAEGLTFSTLIEMGECLKFLLEKGEVRKNGRGLPYYIGVFLEIPHDAAKELLQ